MERGQLVQDGNIIGYEVSCFHKLHNLNALQQIFVELGQLLETILVLVVPWDCIMWD